MRAVSKRRVSWSMTSGDAERNSRATSRRKIGSQLSAPAMSPGVAPTPAGADAPYAIGIPFAMPATPDTDAPPPTP